MPEDIDKVTAALRFLDLRPNIDSYVWRFLIQKTSCLAQALGFPINYQFTIYVKGPYSPTLACDYYNFKNRVASLETTYNLTPRDSRILQKIREEVLDKVETVKDISGKFGFLESVSTATCLIRGRQVKDDLFAELKQLKPYLSDSLIVIGINKAKELLFKPEYLTPEIEEEIEKWDRVDS